MVKAHKDEHDLIKAVREMSEHRKGKTTLPTRKILPPDEIDVASIRKRLGYNQRQFAEHFGFSMGAIKDWEQGRRRPERSARLFLAVINANPKVVEKTLKELR